MFVSGLCFACPELILFQPLRGVPNLDKPHFLYAGPGHTTFVIIYLCSLGQQSLFESPPEAVVYLNAITISGWRLDRFYPPPLKSASD